MRNKPILKRNTNESRIKNAYSKAAWIYDFWNNLFEVKVFERVVELAEPTGSENFLEAAVGTGYVFEKVARLNVNGMNEGLDLSPAMLRKAEKRMNRTGIKNYHLQTGSVLSLPYESVVFDLIINNFMFDLLPESSFNTILSEFYRVLKPGGKLIISTMCLGNKWYNGIWYYIAKLLPLLLLGCRPVSLSKYIVRSGFKIDKVENISQLTLPSEVIRAYKQSNN
jgi:ubiquinone/menaquinone biosynthesis C-methylase UbiE